MVVVLCCHGPHQGPGLLADGHRSSRTPAVAGVNVDPLLPYLTFDTTLPLDHGTEHLGQPGDQTSIGVPRILGMAVEFTTVVSVLWLGPEWVGPSGQSTTDPAVVLPLPRNL